MSEVDSGFNEPRVQRSNLESAMVLMAYVSASNLFSRFTNNDGRLPILSG